MTQGRRRVGLAHRTAGPARRDGHPGRTRRCRPIRGQPGGGAGCGRRRVVGGLSARRRRGVRGVGAAEPDHPDGRGAGQPTRTAGVGTDHSLPAGQPATGRRDPFAALHDAAGGLGTRCGDAARRDVLLRPRIALGVKGRFFRAWTRTALRRAAVCVVPSRATARELYRFARADRRRWWWPITAWTSPTFHVPRPEQIAAVAEHLGSAVSHGSRSWAPWSHGRTCRRWSGPTFGR